LSNHCSYEASEFRTRNRVRVSSTVIEFPSDGPCPCDGGKTVEDCRCKNRRFVPLPVDTKPPGIFTGMRVPRCYAQGTSDCAPPVSREHAIAESISREFRGTPTTRTLIDGSTRIVLPSTAGRKVLCRRHNSALSPLDEVGRRFVLALKQQIKHRLENSPRHTHILFNGFDIERWMLKVLCAMAHGERVSRIYASTTFRVPQSWLRVLFEGHPLPPGAGLYTPRVYRGRFNGGILTAKIVGHSGRTGQSGSLLFDPSDGAKVLGISMCIYGNDFDLHMSRPLEARQNWYRPRMYRMRSDAGGVSHLHMGWDELPPTFLGKIAPVDYENSCDPLLR
jgi:hypothetical protein